MAFTEQGLEIAAENVMKLRGQDTDNIALKPAARNSVQQLLNEIREFSEGTKTLEASLEGKNPITTLNFLGAAQALLPDGSEALIQVNQKISAIKAAELAKRRQKLGAKAIKNEEDLRAEFEKQMLQDYMVFKHDEHAGNATTIKTLKDSEEKALQLISQFKQNHLLQESDFTRITSELIDTLPTRLKKLDSDLNKCRDVILKMNRKIGTSDPIVLDDAMRSAASHYKDAQALASGEKTLEDFASIPKDKKIELVVVCYAIASDDQKAKLRMNPEIAASLVPEIAASLVIVAPPEEKQKLHHNLGLPFIREQEELFHQTILAHQSSKTTSLRSKIENLEIYQLSYNKLEQLKRLSFYQHSSSPETQRSGIKITPDFVSTKLIAVREQVSRLNEASSKEDVRECVASISQVIPSILNSSRSEHEAAVANVTPKLTKLHKEEESLQKHINRIARDALKDAGKEVKRTWKEAFSDLFASKKEREQVKAKITNSGIDLRKLLTRKPTEAQLYKGHPNTSKRKIDGGISEL